jgi:membrane-bound lytic murein transglycosylase D
METRMANPAARSRTCARARVRLALVACVLLGVVISSRAGRAAATATGKTPARSGPGGKSPVTGPHEESLSQRRAVRGVPVDDGTESPELNELRRFEELAFPRTGGVSGTADGDAVSDPPPSLPGKWQGSGDVPEALRTPDATPTPARVAPAPDSEWLRSLKLPELPVRWDPQVLRYIDYFKNDTRGRSIMSNWLKRSGRFRLLFESVLEREGLPKDLIYVAMVESGFETGARSPVGAGGVWQFMPGAARAYGLEVGYWVDARRDPERSVEAAARYLKDLYVRFGSWHLVFAAYNAGYGAVLKSITRYNTNDFWELCHHEAGLPWESSLYVPKILAAAIVGHNLEAFGYGDIVPDPPFAYEKVEVPPGTGLATVARAVKVRPDVLASLNPQILRERTPPERGQYQLRVPPGTSTGFAENLERGSGAGDRLDTVTLRFGETLDDIAKARSTTVRELKRLNGVKDTSELRAGIAIVVPQKSTRANAKNAAARDTATATGALSPTATAAGDWETSAPGAAADDDEILVAVPDRVFNYEGRERVFYRTRDGDLLGDIAEAVGVRPDDLVEWNSLDPSAKLHPKMVLQIFVRKDFDPKDIVLLDSAHVRVVALGSQEFLELEAARRGKKRLVIEAKTGDTLVRIGRRYGLTVGDLARINRFSYNTDLQNGQKVIVYSPVGDGPREVAQGLTRDPRRDRGAVGLGRSGASKPTDKSGDRSNGKSSGKSNDNAVARGRSANSTGAKESVVRAVAENASGDRTKVKDKAGEKAAGKTVAKAPPARTAPKKK